MRILTTAVLLVLAAANTINFGAIAGETVMLYPNIFRDPPDSLVLAREFMVAGSPSDFFPPLGFTIIVGSFAAVALTWRRPHLRWWLVAATVVYVCCELLFSVWFFWPRNEIMFVDPVGTHAPEYLRQVAAEFEAAHWVRVIGSAVAAALATTAALRWYRETIETDAARPVVGTRGA